MSVSITSSAGTTVCSGDSVVLSKTGNTSALNTYQWNDASGAISGATTSSYTASSSGTYSLTVTTPAGCSATSSGLAVNVVTVSAPTGMSASNVGLTKATLNWSAVTNAHHYDIRMREQGSSTWTISLNNLYLTSVLKTGLTSATTYEWEIRSACSSGSNFVSAWSSTQTFTTATPCTTPVNIVTTNIGITSATLGWDAVSGAWGYVVRYKQTSPVSSAWAYVTVNTNSYSLTGLTSGGVYRWQIYSMCDANNTNNSPFSSNVIFTTTSCNLSLSTSQTNVTCNGNSDGAIDLSISGGSGSYSYLWSNGATTEDLTSLSAGSYSVTVTDNTCNTTATTSVTITEPSVLSVSITSSAGTTVCSGDSVVLSKTGNTSALNTYQWNDASGAISGATTSSYTASSSGTYSLTVTTPAGCSATSSGLAVNVITVSAPTGMSASNVGLTKATLNWSAVTNAHHYDIRMREQGSSTWTISLNNLYLTSVLKTGLTSATTYEWEIRSACSSGSNFVSAWSSTQTFTTATPCTTPVNRITTNIALTSATLGWDAVSGAWGYVVRYKQTSPVSSAWTYVTVNTNSYSLTGLTSGGVYRWQIYICVMQITLIIHHFHLMLSLLQLVVIFL